MPSAPASLSASLRRARSLSSLHLRPLLLGLTVALLAAGVRAQDAPNGRISLPFGPFASAAEQQLTKHWVVDGPVKVVRRKGAEDRPEFAVRLGAKATLQREVTIEPIRDPKGGKLKADPSRWHALLTVAFRAQKTSARLQVLLFRGDAKRPTERREFRLRPGRPMEGAMAVLDHGTGEKLQGVWKVVIRNAGRTPVLVDALAWTRVPLVPEQMHYAKPNGKRGPDQLLSGALGLEGHATHEQMVLPIKAVREGSPAARAGLKPGDILVEVAGRPLRRNSCDPGHRWFWEGHEATLGRAVESALAKGRGKTSLGVWRADGVTELEVRLAQREALVEGFPFEGESAERLYDELIAYVRKMQKPNGSWAIGGNDWIQTAIGGLALLGRRDPADAEAIERAALWFLRKFPDPEAFGNLGYWSVGYSGTFLSEYLMATGDERVRPWMQAALDWVQPGYHTTKWGMPGLGHGPNGLPYDNKGLIAPASHLLTFEALARPAGFQSSIWEDLRPYWTKTWSDPKEGGHGAMGYNPSYKDNREFWSRSGLFLMSATLRDEEPRMRKALVEVMGRRHAWMRNSHAYGYPGASWGLLGLARADRKVFGEVMDAWRPLYGGMWEPGFGLRPSMAHMGSPYMGQEGLVNLTTAMLFSVRNKGLVMTGCEVKDAGWLREGTRSSAASRLIAQAQADGRIALRALIPGAAIHYTLDGTEPGPRAGLYREAIALPEGGRIRAVAIAEDGRKGPSFDRSFDWPKSAWKILECNGAATEKEAIERALPLIDGDPRRPWQPNRGEGSEALPLVVTLDLGSVQWVAGIQLKGNNIPQEVRVAASRSRNRWSDAAAASYEQGAARFEQPVRCRYLRLQITKAPKNNRLRFGELDLLRPALGLKREKKVLAIAERQDELSVQARTGEDEWKTLKLPAKLRPRAGLALRLATPDGEAAGPVILP